MTKMQLDVNKMVQVGDTRKRKFNFQTDFNEKKAFTCAKSKQASPNKAIEVDSGSQGSSELENVFKSLKSSLHRKK